MSNYSEFCVNVGGESITCLLAEPDQLSDRPALLLNFATDRTTNLQQTPYDITPRLFLAAGHRAASFDLPCHGDRGAPGQPGGIAGVCDHWTHGTDVFARFVDEGRAVIDELIRRGLVEPGRIFVSGISRGAYCALRLMAGDQRIAGVAAFAPVTDWRVLVEFDVVRDDPALADLALTCFTDALAGRAVWVAIGNQDARVQTPCCLRFVETLIEAELAAPGELSQVVLHVVPAAGHRMPDDWYRRGGEYLSAMAGRKQE